MKHILSLSTLLSVYLHKTQHTHHYIIIKIHTHTSARALQVLSHSMVILNTSLCHTQPFPSAKREVIFLTSDMFLFGWGLSGVQSFTESFLLWGNKRTKVIQSSLHTEVAIDRSTSRADLNLPIPSRTCLCRRSPQIAEGREPRSQPFISNRTHR